MKGPEDSFDHIPESDHSNAASFRSSEDEHQGGHFESLRRRNRSAAYSSLAIMLNSENAESHAEGVPHDLKSLMSVNERLQISQTLDYPPMLSL